MLAASMLAADLMDDWFLSEAGKDERKDRILKRNYEQALALRNLNNNPKLNESLDSSVGKGLTALTLEVAQRVLISGSLTDEQRAALCHLTAFSWLDLHGYTTIIQLCGVARLPIDWQFSETASPAEKKDYMLKEMQFVAARLKPRALKFDKIHEDVVQDGVVI
jgi:hypothetical protein